MKEKGNQNRFVFALHELGTALTFVTLVHDQCSSILFWFYFISSLFPYAFLGPITNLNKGHLDLCVQMFLSNGKVDDKQAYGGVSQRPCPACSTTRRRPRKR